MVDVNNVMKYEYCYSTCYFYGISSIFLSLSVIHNDVVKNYLNTYPHLLTALFAACITTIVAAFITTILPAVSTTLESAIEKTNFLSFNTAYRATTQ